MKIISLYEGKDVESFGLVGLVKTSGSIKKIKKIVFVPESKYLNKLPKSIFTIILYKNDTFSDTLVGMERLSGCEVLKMKNGGLEVDIGFTEKEEFNTDEMNKVRSSRIGLFLQDGDDS